MGSSEPGFVTIAAVVGTDGFRGLPIGGKTCAAAMLP